MQLQAPETRDGSAFLAVPQDLAAGDATGVTTARRSLFELGQLVLVTLQILRLDAQAAFYTTG